MAQGRLWALIAAGAFLIYVWFNSPLTRRFRGPDFVDQGLEQCRRAPRGAACEAYLDRIDPDELKPDWRERR